MSGLVSSPRPSLVLDRRQLMMLGAANIFPLASHAADGCTKMTPIAETTSASPGKELNTIYGDDLIEISHEMGDGDEGIVSFTGIGFGMGGIQVEEFRKSLAASTNHIYYVKDKSRHWYNSSAEKITNFLNAEFSCRRISKVITVGNSMGGFGAILFAASLDGCHRAIAFAAQSAIDPSIVPWDQRFNKLTSSVKSWAGLDAVKSLRRDVSYFAFFGANDPIDVRHAERLIEANSPNMTVCLIENSGHDVSFDLKKAGVLSPLMKALVDSDADCVDFKSLLRDVNFRVAKRPARCS